MPSDGASETIISSVRTCVRSHRTMPTWHGGRFDADNPRGASKRDGNAQEAKSVKGIIAIQYSILCEERLDDPAEAVACPVLFACNGKWVVRTACVEETPYPRRAARSDARKGKPLDQRSRRDSNPRYLSVKRFSRPSP